MRVSLNGIVAADDDVEIYQWFGMQAFGPRDVREAITPNPTGEDLVLEINSGGGSVMAGSEMYSVLRSAESIRTRAEVQSLAASAASYLMLGCDEVMMSPAAQVMIHLPSTQTTGDRNDHLGSVHVLDTIRESILNVYELKAKGGAPYDAAYEEFLLERLDDYRRVMERPMVTGQDLIAAGLRPGPEFRRMLERARTLHFSGLEKQAALRQVLRERGR